MKLGPLTKLDKRNKTTSKQFDDDVISKNCAVIAIFSIYGQFLHPPPNSKRTPKKPTRIRVKDVTKKFNQWAFKFSAWSSHACFLIKKWDILSSLFWRAFFFLNFWVDTYVFLRKILQIWPKYPLSNDSTLLGRIFVKLNTTVLLLNFSFWSNYIDQISGIFRKNT